MFTAGTGDWYGGFLADVIQHFLVDEGVSKIKYVSPMNEPDSTFGPSPCGQEGMQVTQYQYALLLRLMRADWLSAASLHDGALAAVADLALTLLVLLFRSPTDLVVP